MANKNYTNRNKYYCTECEICQNKNNFISKNENKFSNNLNNLNTDSKILTFTFNLKKNKIIKNYNRCKKCKNFVNSKKYYFQIYLFWLYYLKNKNLKDDFDYY